MYRLDHSDMYCYLYEYSDEYQYWLEPSTICIGTGINSRNVLASVLVKAYQFNTTILFILFCTDVYHNICEESVL